MKDRPFDVEAYRARAKARYEREVSEDPRREDRLSRHECRACYYTIRINGQAFTEYTCQMCGTAGMHHNTGVPRLCGPCAEAKGLCARCMGRRTDMKIYVLTYAEGEYDDYRHVPVGATTDPAKAEAWRDGVVPNHDHDYDELELDDLSEHGVGERIADYLDPLKNPFCECGHKLSQHSTRGKKRCGKDTKGHGLKPGNPSKHTCGGFRLAPFPALPPPGTREGKE